jgi:phosphatidylinositol dimannoside acyltransferase
MRVESRDLFELVLLPGLAALLPWSLAFRLLRRIARGVAPYEGTTRAAMAQAGARGWLGDAGHWSLVRRIVTLVDHADLYLARTRSDAWMARHMDVQGHWPPAGEAGLICTFHWGAGMWGLRHAHASGLKAHALVAPLEGAHFAGRRVLLGYARARTAEVTRALGCPALDTSVSLRPVLQAVRRGEQVVAAIDVPADQVSASEEICLLGMRAHVPRGLLRLAVDLKLPVTVYLTGLNVESGRRFLRIHQLGVRDSLEQLIADVFAYLDQAVREDPPSWHFWSEADRIFVRSEAANVSTC